MDPPGPVVPVRVAAPTGEHGAVLPLLVDTGADCTLIPRKVARALRLPAVDRIWIEGVGGASRRATVHAARVEFARIACLARVVAFGGEAILGRDLLNRAVALLDGPGLRVSFRDAARSAPRVASQGTSRWGEPGGMRLRRALWEREEQATADAYRRQPDSVPDVYLDARAWEPLPRGRRRR